MKSRSAEKIKLTSIDELLGVVNEESAMEIDISKIHAFKDHPFKVLDDEKMTDLVESVKAKGILTPVLLRSDGEDGYEMISGHRRMYAAIRAGLETIPAIVRELSDDDAVIAMVDAKKLNFTIAVDISYIDKEMQKWIYEYIRDTGFIKPKQITALRKQLEEGPVNQGFMISIFNSCIVVKAPERKVVLSGKKLTKYFPEDYSETDMEKVIETLLEQWKREQK